MAERIPPADEQFEVLSRGTVDLNPVDDFKKRLAKSHESQTPMIVKVGFDPTAPDLHLGHTVVIEKMAQFQRFGHDVVFLVGDYTALIGDPTGRNAMRPPLTESQIKENAKTYTDQVFKILDREKTRVEWNSAWLSDLSFADVIGLASKYNVGRMLERRDFKDRFEQNKQIALHEFLYPLMQGYDSVALKCDIELGGQDQIFNLNVGRHLMPHYDVRPQCVLTTGLLVGLDGVDKMSKSKGNHVGITDAPREMFGKVMSISDDNMWATWYPLLTDTTPDQSDPNAAKQAIAHQMVTRFHDQKSADEVLAWWRAGRPATNLEEIAVSTGPMYAIMVEAGMATSNSDARRKIKGKGVRLDDNGPFEDEKGVVAPGEYVLRVGKKNRKLIRVS